MDTKMKNLEAENLRLRRVRTSLKRDNSALRVQLKEAWKRISELEAAQSMGEWIVVGEIEGPEETQGI
jgi:hypothetical protein